MSALPQKADIAESDCDVLRSNFLIAGSVIRHRRGSQSKIDLSERVPRGTFGELQVAEIGSKS
jgi:hypothetical protein